MNKVGLADHLKTNTSAIVDLLLTLPAGSLNNSADDIWSIGENAIHLVKSVAPINIALNLPKIAFLIFGRTEVNRSYDEMVRYYQSKLKNGAKASKAYIPKSGKKTDRSALSASFRQNYDRLIEKMNEWSEDDLDTYRLPHPILGKLTIREMLYFTIYHLEHHYNRMKELAVN